MRPCEGATRLRMGGREIICMSGERSELRIQIISRIVAQYCLAVIDQQEVDSYCIDQ